MSPSSVWKVTQGCTITWVGVKVPAKSRHKALTVVHGSFKTMGNRTAGTTKAPESHASLQRLTSKTSRVNGHPKELQTNSVSYPLPILRCSSDSFTSPFSDLPQSSTINKNICINCHLGLCWNLRPSFLVSDHTWSTAWWRPPLSSRRWSILLSGRICVLNVNILVNPWGRWIDGRGRENSGREGRRQDSKIGEQRGIQAGRLSPCHFMKLLERTIRINSVRPVKWFNGNG